MLLKSKILNQSVIKPDELLSGFFYFMEEKMERKVLTVPFEIKKTNEDEKYFTFSGYASTFGNRDRGGDVVVKGAFIESLKKNI